MSAVKRAGPVKLVMTLGIAGFVSGLVLVTVYLATLPLIEQNQREALAAAVFRVVPGSQDRKAFVVRDGKLQEVEGEGATGDFYGAYGPDGSLLGYAIPAQGAGFQDTIKLIYGYSPEADHVIGMEVLESRETPGLGDKIIKDQKFLENFRSLAVSPEVVAVKAGTKSADNEVDSISGATISSKAVVSIINQSNRVFLPVIEASSQAVENPQ